MGGTVQPAWGLGAALGGLASLGLYALNFSNPVIALGGLGVGLVSHFLSEPAAGPGLGGPVGGGLAPPPPVAAFNLTAGGLANLVLSKSAEIQGAIEGGAGWEIWLQVELTRWLRARGCQVAREVPYGDGQALDILTRHNATNVAIEIKVESATNAGAGFVPSVRADIQKIQGYNTTAVDERWVLAVAYSVTARGRLAEYGRDLGVTYVSDGVIGVAVVHADMF